MISEMMFSFCVPLKVRQIKELTWGEGEKPIHTQQFKVY
jgi:hypothetical protein